MKAISNIALLVLVVASVSFPGCKGESPEPTPKFDKEAMLRNIGATVIRADYSAFEVSLKSLRSAVVAFRDDPSSSSLNDARTAFKEAYAAWGLVESYEFGPAADVGLRLAVNTYPVDTARVNENIEGTLFDPAHAQNAKAKGFPAIDFLFFGRDKLEVLSDSFRVVYILKNIDYIAEKLQSVIDDWNGSYLDEFSTNTGSDVGGSISLLVNELNYNFELSKNARVGIPMGKKTLGVPQPEKAEAIFSGASVSVLEANVRGIESAIFGNPSDGSSEGLGLDDYLDAIDARYEGILLTEAIQNGFAEVQSAIGALTVSAVHEAVDSEPAKLDAVHVAMQNLVVLLKVDMPSRLGIQITYQDNDGD